MLDAAAGMIADLGIAVSLDHLRFDEVIDAADVARTSAYRRWPTKDLFIADLLVELARGSHLGSGWGETGELLITTLHELLPRPTDVDPAQDRLDVVVEILRVSAQADVEAIHASPEWRLHIALQATLLGLPPGELRRSVGDNLRRAEERFGDSRAETFRRLAELWGYRPVDPDLGPGASDHHDGFAQLSLALSSTMTGLIIRSSTDPGLLEPRWELAPFGTRRRDRWSAPALALVRTILAHLEPGPAEGWGDQRIEEAVDELRRLGASAPPDEA